MKLNLTRNQKNVIKFSLCALAVVGALWLTTVNDWKYYHYITIVYIIVVVFWYVYHVFTDK